MPLETQTYDLEETLESKREALEEIAETVAGLEPDNPAYKGQMREGNAIESHIEGLAWALKNWEVEEVTLGAMTGGEVAQMENELAKDGTGPGDGRIATIVHGTIDAPYLRDEQAKTYYHVGQLQYGLQKWLETEIEDLTSGNANSGPTFGDLLEAKRHEQDGTDDSK